MKLDIQQNSTVQTAIRLPEDHWNIIIKLAEENKCEKSDVIRLMIKTFIITNKLNHQ